MVSKDNDVGIAMALVIGAGCATGIGASVVFFPTLVRYADNKTLAGALGLSAGVMVYVSFAEVFIKSQMSFEDAGYSEDQSRLYATLCFFAGVAFMVALNKFVTFLLGGHHHHDNGENQKTTGLREDEEDEDDDEDDSMDDESDVIPPCVCHDENPRETLNKMKEMAHTMEEEPNQPHSLENHHHHHHHGSQQQSTHNNQGQDDTENRDTTIESRRPPNQPVDHTGQEKQVDFDEAYEMAKEQSGEPERARSVTIDAPPDKSDEGPPKVISTSQDEESDATESQQEDEVKKKKLMMMSLNTALAIGLHNFPEGLATFVAALDDPKVGAVLAVAIAIHNIPEGLCVAMPIYYSTGNKWKAFGWALLSGVSEPLAGLLGWLILSQSFSDELYGFLFGAVGGMMVIISARELLPTAHRYDPEDTVVTFAFIGGMGIMALSLMLFLLA